MFMLIQSMSEHEVLAFACEELERAFRAADKKACGRLETVYIGTAALLDRLPDAVRGAAERELSSWDREAEDAFAVVPVDQGRAVVLVGSCERSALFAAYTLLERVLGIVAVYPGETAAKPAVPLDAPMFGRPALKRRGFVFETINEPEYIASMIDWMAKNRVSEIFFTFMLWEQLRDRVEPEIRKRGMKLTLGGHSLKFFMEAGSDSGASDHPYNAKKQADFANAAWTAETIRRIVSYCRTVPNLTRLSLWPEDIGLQKEASDEGGSFLPVYIAFTEQLREAVAAVHSAIQVEHIAYNAGLSWEMLERLDVTSSAETDTLFAYWGRNYREPLADVRSAETMRAFKSLLDWRAQTSERGRELTAFEYYSDHFMLSYIFPMLPRRIAEDAEAYRQLGVDGVINLVVPYRPKPSTAAYNPDTVYDWHWIHGCNSFFYARLAWGGSLEEAMSDYLCAYAPSERESARKLLESSEELVSPLTGWNVPLFPARAVDPEKVTAIDSGMKEQLLQHLRSLQGLEALLPPSPQTDSATMQRLRKYVSGLASSAQALERQWTSGRKS